MDRPAGAHGGGPLHVVVATVVHHPEDARILHRQIGSLLEAGHRVTYVAPFADTATRPWSELEAVDVPRAAGRERVAAYRAARSVLRRLAAQADVVLVHDAELLLALPRRPRAVLVWDVHEDTPASLAMKSWLPRLVRPLARSVVQLVEGRAHGRVHLQLAEEGYQHRLGDHPVVPNGTQVPATVLPPGDDRVVYLGTVTRHRGSAELVQLGRLLTGTGITLHVVGGADGWSTELLTRAVADGLLVWHGRTPNPVALRSLGGALAGLSPLHDQPNYRHSLPTKVVEYMAHGVPVVTTPNPVAAAVVTDAGAGIVVPFQDPAAMRDAVLALRDDVDRRVELGAAGHRAARAHHDWTVLGPRFVRGLEGWVQQARAAGGARADG